MIRLNRTTEYGLIALRHISQKQATLSSAREIADTYGLPFEITAKTLQRLKEVGLILSTQGARGGYLLSPTVEQASLAQFIEWMEGNSAIVCCVEAGTQNCEYQVRCEIQHLMGDLNSQISGFFSQIRLIDFITKKTVTHGPSVQVPVSLPSANPQERMIHA